jgi:tetratricopeptide (TPR) repeat protein
MQVLRGAIAAVRATPSDGDARRRLRAIAVEHGMLETLAVLLADEARAAGDRTEVAAAFYEEVAEVHESLDQPLETIAAMEKVVSLVPDDIEHLDRLAWLYRRAGAAVKAAHAFERVAAIARDARAHAALRAAGTLYREAGKLDQAAATFRSIVRRRAGDIESWRTLEEILVDLQRWPEVAQVRGVLAERATGVDKAVLLRGQARALEQAGDPRRAAELVAAAAQHAPDDVSGIVDYASVLAREGKAREAADVLAQRIDDGIADGAPPANIAALRLRLVDTLAAGGDHAGADAVLGELLATMPDYAPARDRLVEAARRSRASGDLDGAVRAFERARDLSPGDVTFADELARARLDLAAQRATRDMAHGDAASAERVLREIITHDRMHEEANLALARLLASSGRGDAALEHLRATIAAAAPDAAPESIARFVHAQAMITTDEEVAHQLLRDAHQLSRRDIQITLALGESCFKRKLYREAAIHLGSLANHPDAPGNASVAAGLVRAGQAEIRALKPGNAQKHYEAAVRIDPGCPAAWHQLAELATERGDVAAAADCVEREAAATKDPAVRLRLYDALGDLCRDVLDDSARAERCWALAATTSDEGVLDKLLAIQRARGAVRERAETCERLAGVVRDPARAKALTVEAATTFVAAGDVARARALADQLVRAHPSDTDAIDLASQLALAAGDHTAAAQMLRRLLLRDDSDPRRPELLRRLGDAERGRGDERAALDAYQRAVAAGPDTDSAIAARRALIDLASNAGRRADTSRLELFEAEQDPREIIVAARELAARQDRAAEARSMFELAGALGVEPSLHDKAFLFAHPVRAMASDEPYAIALDDAERRALIDDPADGIVGELLAIIAEAIALVAPDVKTALATAALTDARRPPATSDAAALAIYPQISKALGGPATLLYASPSLPEDAAVVLATPPIVVLGPALARVRAGEDDTALRFQLGRLVELARPHRALARMVTREDFVAFGPGRRLHDVLPVALRQRVRDRLATTDVARLDTTAYLGACERAADRSGLVACGSPAVAIALAGGPTSARHVVELAASQRYLAAQRKLRVRVAR